MSQFQIPTMIFHNPTEHTVKLDALGLDPVGPGQDCEIPLYLAAPTRTDNGNRGKSPVEQVAPQLHPKNEEDRKLWLEVPTPVAPQSKIVSVTARMPSESPGVKALREKKEAAEASKAKATQTPANTTQKATASPQANVSAPAGKP